MLTPVEQTEQRFESIMLSFIDPIHLSTLCFSLQVLPALTVGVSLGVFRLKGYGNREW